MTYYGQFAQRTDLQSRFLEGDCDGVEPTGDIFDSVKNMGQHALPAQVMVNKCPEIG